MFFHLMKVGNFWLYLLEFALAATVILLSGARLAYYGDKLAEGSKFSSSWIGFILLAFITSLPELMTGISATAIVKSVDLVVSDTIGSNAFNIVILAVMFFFVKKKGEFSMKIEEILTAFAGLLLLGITGVFIYLNPFFQNPQVAEGVKSGISIVFTVVLAIGYFLIVYVAFKTGGLEEEVIETERDEKHIGLKFSLLALVIVAASMWMTKSADLLAGAPIGANSIILGQTLVGGILVAIATSLPELSVTLSAARLGNTSMAVGNILGSNIFNLFILPVSAVFYKGIFWKDVSPTNIYWVFLTLLVTAVVGMDLIYKTKFKTNRVGVFNVITPLLWLAGAIFIFFVR